jgi:hypothetical protein
MMENTETKIAMTIRARAGMSILIPQPTMSATAAKEHRKYRGANTLKGVTRDTTKRVTSGRTSQPINRNTVARGIWSGAIPILRQAKDAASTPKRRALARVFGMKDDTNNKESGLSAQEHVCSRGAKERRFFPLDARLVSGSRFRSVRSGSG